MASFRNFLDYLSSLRLFRRTPDRTAKRAERRRYRPTLEVLEDRITPAIHVMNTNASGAGSLAAAINQANNTTTNPGLDTIDFVNLFGHQVISLTSALPSITDPVIIDGTSVGGWNNTSGPLIEITGNHLALAGLILASGSSGSTIDSLVINDFSVYGVLVASGNNTVKGCYVGTDFTGSSARPNWHSGVMIMGAGATGNTIGGGRPNLISGNGNGVNQGWGVYLSAASGNTVSANTIGLDATRTFAIPNFFDGVVADALSTSNLIGGKNTISGNNRAGVNLYGAVSNKVAGNTIGLNAAGASVPNLIGVWLYNAKNNTIGGTGAAQRNVISGNHAFGVDLQGSGTTGNAIATNYIGTNPAGTGAVPNGVDGVFIYGGPTNNYVGGALPATGNTIAGNRRSGVTIAGAGTSGNFVFNNRIGLDPLGNALPNPIGVWITNGASGNVVGSALTITGPNTIVGNSLFGVFITGAGTSGNFLAGNFIGVKNTGTGSVPNGFDGVYIGAGASNNVIGGSLAGTPQAALPNVISGNGRDGIRIEGLGTTGNTVQGNYIGLQADGVTPMGNLANGVRLGAGAANNSIGLGTVATRNFISSNIDNGVLITDSLTNNNQVLGNAIGTDVSRTLPRGNNVGVLIAAGAHNNLVKGFPNPQANSNIVFNAAAGVRITGLGTNNNTVQNNHIGRDAAGAAASNTVGVDITNGARFNNIGDGNVIVGNTSNNAGTFPGYGIWIHGALTLGNTVFGNFIGTSQASQLGVGNGIGVKVSDVGGVTNLADANVIGGTAAGLRNVISGNAGAGILVTGSGISPLAPMNGISALLIQQNFIGTDTPGSGPLANQDGIVIQNDTVNVLVGGSVSGAGNVLSGNTRYGLLINGNGTNMFTTSNIVVQGNLIGTQANGTSSRANGSHGIFITGSSAHHNTIGGMLETTPGAANIIAFNLGNGIRIGSDAAPFNVDAGMGNAVLGNRIFNNTLIGLDLGGDNGVTANDGGDGDGGSNNTQNFPVITFAAMVGSIAVSGTLDSDGPDGTVYRVEFFVGAAAGNADVYLGYVDVVLIGGTGTFAVGLPYPSTFLGRKIIATATRLDTMDTSEFSGVFTAL